MHVGGQSGQRIEKFLEPCDTRIPCTVVPKATGDTRKGVRLRGWWDARADGIKVKVQMQTNV